MTQAVRKSTAGTKLETGRFHWTDQEAKDVALRYVPSRYAEPHLTIPVALSFAQRVLPEDRRRDFMSKPQSSYTIAHRLNAMWAIFIRTEPERAARLLEEAKTGDSTPVLSLVKTETPVEPTTPQETAAPPAAVEAPAPAPAPAVSPSQMVATAPALAPQHHSPQDIAKLAVELAAAFPPAPWTPPPPVAPHLGPMELAMQALVQRAVEGSVMAIMNEMRARFEVMQEDLQSLVNAHHDSLLSYFDPDFKRMHEVQAEFITEGINKAELKLKEHRMRKKTVLVVCTNNIQGIQRTLETRFNGIDFTYIDGGATKLKADGMYDLVLCNATNRPAVKDKLAFLHGNKVVFIPGGTESMVETIRKRFGI